MKIGFDNNKYLKMQSEHIRERINQFGDKLYLEFGGKLFDDYHASRVLPGFAPDSKLRMLLQLADQAEIVIVISAADIEKNKVRSDLGITYDVDVLRLIQSFTDKGLYFAEQWSRALEVDPEFVFVTGWNEWTAGKYQPGGEGKTVSWLRRQSPFFFVDQYNAEFNRCIHPVKGGYTDNYYMQMAQNLRRYKGARPIPRLEGYAEAKADGDFGE